MPATYRYGQAATQSILAFLQGGLAAFVTTISTEEAWNPALEAVATFRAAITKTPTESVGVEIDLPGDEPWPEDIKNDIWDCDCIVSVFTSGADADEETAAKRLRAYHSALVRALRSDPTLGGKEIDCLVGRSNFRPPMPLTGQILRRVDHLVTVRHQES